MKKERRKEKTECYTKKEKISLIIMAPLSRSERRNMQSNASVVFPNNQAREIPKINGRFKCFCNISYKRPDKLQKHTKTCSFPVPAAPLNTDDPVVPVPPVDPAVPPVDQVNPVDPAVPVPPVDPAVPVPPVDPAVPAPNPVDPAVQV